MKQYRLLREYMFLKKGSVHSEYVGHDFGLLEISFISTGKEHIALATPNDAFMFLCVPKDHLETTGEGDA